MAVNDSAFFGSATNYEKLTVSSAAIGFTATKYEHFNDELAVGAANALVDARSAYVTVEATNGLRYTLDGTTPIGGTTGHLAAGGSTFIITGHVNIEKFRAIRDSGVDAVIHVTYFA